MQMVPSHTDVMNLAQFSGYFSLLVTVACFNFMVLADEINSKTAYHTSFINFYAGMLKTPYLGDKLNYILPGSIILVSIAFVAISLTGYEQKFVKVMRTGKFSETVSQRNKVTT